MVVYAVAVMAGVAVTGTRPAQATLIPSVAATPDQLTAANVLVGWVEAAGFAAAGLLAGALIALGGVAAVFAVLHGLGLGAAMLVARLRAVTFAPPSERTTTALAGLAESLRLTASRPRLRLMLGLLTAQAAVASALDLLIVILAVSVLGLSHAWVGYLNFVYGVGAVLAATLSVVLIGGRLGVPILAAALLLSIAIAALAFDVGLAVTVALLVVAGAASLLDVSNRILLQRSVPAQLIGQVFGILEGLQEAGWALGALLVPLLVYLGGHRLALLGVAAVLPLAAALGGRGLFNLDAEAPVPVVEIALLRSLPLFAELPGPAIEALAASLTPGRTAGWHRADPPGRSGDAYYAIAAGELDVQQDGRFLRRCRRARRRHRGNRAAALDPAHGDRHRALRRDPVPAQPGALPDRGAGPCPPHPPRGPPHRQRAAARPASRRTALWGQAASSSPHPPDWVAPHPPDSPPTRLTRYDRCE